LLGVREPSVLGWTCGSLRHRGVSTEEGKEQLLRDVLKDHLPILRQERLVPDRPPYLMRAADGTFVEVFEWKSAAAIEAAHHSSAVQAMWGDSKRLARKSPSSTSKNRRTCSRTSRRSTSDLIPPFGGTPSAGTRTPTG